MSTRSPRRSRFKKSLAIVPAIGLAAGGLTAVTPTADAATKTPNTTKLAGALAKQKLTWEKCDFKNASYNTRFANNPNLQCATVKVPRDWHNPGNGKTWDIRISHAKNIDVANPRYKGTIFANPGGPGGSGLVWGPGMESYTPDLNPYYNYVGFDPRGVGQSSTPTCQYSYDSASTDPYAELKAVGAQCGSNEDIKTINTEQTTYDMDFIRALLKAPKLSYVGYSYGTWLGTWYENVFGPNGDKFVLDSAIDGTQPTLQKTWDQQPIARDRQFEMHLMNWIARNDATYHLGTDAQAIYKRYWAASAKTDPFIITIVWMFGGGTSGLPDNTQYPLTADAVKTIIEFGEEAGGSSARKAPATPAAQADAILAKIASKGSTAQSRSEAATARQQIAPLKALPATGSGANKSAAKSASAPTAMTTDVFDDTFDMIRCNDGQWTQGSAYWENWVKKTKVKAPLTDQWGIVDVPVCAFWRSSNMMPVADASTFPKTIVVQGELDSQTAWEGGYAAGTKLPNTSAIFVDNEGSHGLFPYRTECVDRPIINHFLKGATAKDIKVCQGLPLPRETTTYETWGKLNAKGKHVPVNPGPFTPATTAAKVGNGAKLAVEDPQMQKAAKKAVFKLYGQKGVDALERNGALK